MSAKILALRCRKNSARMKLATLSEEAFNHGGNCDICPLPRCSRNETLTQEEHLSPAQSKCQRKQIGTWVVSCVVITHFRKEFGLPVAESNCDSATDVAS